MPELSNQSINRGKTQWPRQLLPLLKPLSGRIALAIGAMVLDAALTLCRPWPLKIVIDRVIALRPAHSRVPFIGAWLDHRSLDVTYILYGACVVTMTIATGTGVLTYLYTRVMGNVGRDVIFALRRKLFAHMQRLSLRFHDRQRTGDLITRLTTDIQNIQDIIATGTIELVSHGLLLSGMAVLMFWLNWRFALASLSMAPLLFWAVFRYTKRIKAATSSARTSDGLLAAVAQETLASIRIVQGLAREDKQDDRFHIFNANSREAYRDGIRYQARIAPMVDILAAAGLAIVMYYGATRVRAGLITTGDVVVFFAYVTNLYAPMKALSRLSYSFSKASVGAERIAEVLSVRAEVTDHKGARNCPATIGAIEFRGVCFEYTPGRPVLSDVNLRIEPRDTVAIVGTTGAGKSTLVSLVPRLYDPTAGAVLLDGEDIRNFKVASLRDRVSLVLQDALLFSGTIRENIAFGRPDASDEQIVEAARIANCHEFIRRLPEGYETMVAEGGTTLSGGQRQRIAIARAVLRDAPILILDEPTASLDAVSERAVVEALQRAAAGRTTLTIAHRLSTIRFANRIIVMEAGRIVEEGNPRELLRCNGTYAGLHRLQFAPS
jgi:ABC-type multidrug transport system fused ATPase/permease subunit